MAVVFTACGSSTPLMQSPTTTPTSLQASPPVQPTPPPTKRSAFPVCNKKVTNAPCVQYASIQDAADGESQPSSKVHTSASKGIVNVVDDITDVEPTPLGPDTALDRIQYQCFNIQQGLWYGLQSTINPGGSQTIKEKLIFRGRCNVH